MTYRECAIVMAFTGKAMLTGDKLEHFYNYIEQLFGRPLMTHEIAYYACEIKERSRNDFVELCRTATEEQNERTESTSQIYQ